MFYVLSGLILAIAVVSFIIFIIMLIKQFKHGGFLHGLIGLITCGLYTFIWGWIKHKNFALTRIMMTWTVLWVASIILPAVMASFGFAEFYKYFNMIEGEMLSTGIDIKNKKLASRVAVASKAREKGVAKKNPARVPRELTVQPNIDPDKAALALWQGEKYSDPNKAVKYWNLVIQNNPNWAEAYNNRGLAYYNLRQYQQAVNDYDKAISINSNYAVAYNNRGNAYYSQGNYKLALADFNKSLSLDTKYAKAHFNRGLAYLQLNNKTQSCREFNLACNLGECEGVQWTTHNGVCQ